jgi:ferredoxin
MPRLHSHRDRPVHLGPLPAERLLRDAAAPVLPARQPEDREAAGPLGVAAVVPEYLGLLTSLFEGHVARAPAPVPHDTAARSNDLKAASYFLDATIAGVCALDASDRLEGADPAHRFALVFAIEFERDASAEEPGAPWVRGCHVARTDLRCAEVAAVLAGYVRALGWPARGHVAGAAQVDLSRLAQRAGIARAEAGVLALPFSRRGFRVGAVTTAFALEPDLPIAAGASLAWPDSGAYLGVGGTRPGFEHDELARQPLHLGRHPMERIPRVAEPTTLVQRERIRRVPKRADLFVRAAAGDLGAIAQRERARFAIKHPLAAAMVPAIRGLVPMQGTRGPVPAPPGAPPGTTDPRRHAEAVKALAHFLGADFAGTCAAEPWMYYSHDEAEGLPIEPYHPQAIVMLIDQGFETMEGASGDDWISGAQSMRAYLRGALVAGVLAAHLRRLGFSARVHSNAHSELLHIPAVLMAGLGELSRIGEVVLNPFIGPRSKSVLVTTELPLEPDRPIDFGVQAMCATCLKCARECPCNAIPFGPKTMFNGYEIWKPDVEKCGRYRLTNMKGSACGRCMKTCPYNREDLVESERLLWLSIDLPEARQALIEHDDRSGGGARNATKRWWFDLEIVDGVAVAPHAGVNERDLAPGRELKLMRGQRLAVFPPELQPAGGTTTATVVPLLRAAGLAAAEAAEPVPAAARSQPAPAEGAAPAPASGTSPP